MYLYPYILIRERLKAKVAELKDIDFFMSQYIQNDRNATVFQTPAAYIQFMPTAMEAKPQKIQTATIMFRVHLVTDNLYDNDKRITGDGTGLIHMDIFNKIFAALEGYAGKLSDVPNLNPVDDAQVINTIDRTNIELVHQLRDVMVSIQDFKCKAFDYSANPVYQSIATPPLNILDA